MIRVFVERHERVIHWYNPSDWSWSLLGANQREEIQDQMRFIYDELNENIGEIKVI